MMRKNIYDPNIKYDGIRESDYKIASSVSVAEPKTQTEQCIMKFGVYIPSTMDEKWSTTKSQSSITTPEFSTCNPMPARDFS